MAETKTFARSPAAAARASAAWRRLLTAGAAVTAAFGMIGVAPAAAAPAAAARHASAAAARPAPAAAHAPAWSAVRSPSATAPQVGLAGVSCPVARACLAVGFYLNRTGVSLPMAKAWNGRKWAVQPVPGSGSLEAVSCTSATACTAVGGTYVPSRHSLVSLAERWNGRKWATQRTPAGGDLSGVSCTSARTCTAVGGDSAERWNGTSWIAEHVATPADAERPPDLTAVSCTAAAVCTAVGDYLSNDDAQTALAEAWDGTAWTLQPVPDLAAEELDLTSVSCPSLSSACVAVGYALDDARRPVSAVRTGTTWLAQPVPVSADGLFLSGVSCTSAASCTAVGSTGDDSGAALMEHWDGSVWTVRSLPRPAGVNLSGVSCTAVTACTAVGTFTSRASDRTVPLAERWNGSTWVSQRIPGSPPGAPLSNTLAAVSCPLAKTCFAVGSYFIGPGAQSLAERWNGTRWVIQQTSGNRPGVVSSVLFGVSCTSATACTAVGEAFTAADQQPLAERWNGRKWVIQQVPRPAGSTQVLLSGVSCTSVRACTAVGQYSPGASEQQPLAERWNGRRWAVQHVPAPAEPFSFSSLNAVSCTSARACIAVGAGGEGGELAERWNGTRWSIQPAGPAGSLSSVSCTSARACTAVGTRLAERWNGTRWKLQPTPGGHLLSVSCVSARICIAVGNGRTHAVAEHWNGIRWVVQRTPGFGSLSGVSCTSARACFAVGSRQDAQTGLTQTLVEHYS